MGSHITTPKLGWSGFEGRIGRRVRSTDLWLDWAPPVKKRRWSSRRPVAPPVAEVIDLSVSGARVVVAELEPMAAGVTVGIGLDGNAGTAAVRRVDASTPGTSVYGIEFKQLDPALRRRIDEILTSDRGELAEQWQRAR